MHEAADNFASAEAQLRRELEKDEARLGSNHLKIAKRLRCLSELYESAGNYPAAEPLRQRVVEILGRVHGERDARYGQGVMELARLYRASGTYRSAEALFHEALEILSVAPGTDHPDYTAALIEQADLYQAIGDYAAAGPLLRKAVEIVRGTHGEESPDFAFALYHMAGLCLSCGDHAAAKEQFRRVLEIDRATRDDEDPDIAASMNNLAHVCLMLGEHADAEPLLREAERIELAARGRDHPDSASVKINLAWALTATGRASEALNLMTCAGEIDDRLIVRIAAIGSESQRMAILARVRSHEEAALSLIFRGDRMSSEALAPCLDLVLRRKALGAELLATQSDAVREVGDLLAQERLDGLTRLRQQIAQLVLAGPGPEGAEEHRQLVGRLKHQMSETELDLARWFPRLNICGGWRDADRNRVALGLPEGSVLVEFVRLHVLNFDAVSSRGESAWGAARYLAFVLPAREPSRAAAIDLGEADPIDRLIAEFRGQITAEADVPAIRDMVTTQSFGKVVSPPTLDHAGAALRAAVFDPLTASFEGRTRLLLAPDGDLCRLPFEVLLGRSGRPLIDDYRISYLSCGRDILRYEVRPAVRSTEPLVVADPDFNLGAAGDGPKAGLPSRRPGRVARDLAPGGPVFGRLPGSRQEGEAVARLLGILPWLDAEALEGRLKNKCRSPLILHISTHGFFLADQEDRAGKPGPHALVPKQGADLGGFSGRFKGSPPENPLLRSGLALAGVNTWLRRGNPPTAAEDGLLTAEDVIGLDLRATELVVLSACDTGLGDIHTGEGVFGLRRAFVLAGARTLVMSLWKVPDEPTRELMENFYGRLLAGQGRAEALRDAQLTIKVKYPEPFYWGAFICQGDPSPLGTMQSGIAGTGIATDRPAGCGISLDRG
jgi:tetratricopeptide (TPR) repeat protein